MNATAQEPRAWVEQLLAGGDRLPGHQLAWLREARAGARQAAAGLTLPDRRQEQWRYSAVEGVLKQGFRPLAEDAAGWQALKPDDWLLPGFDAWRLVFVNGRYVPQAADGGRLPDGVTLGSLRGALAGDNAWLARSFGQAAGHTDQLFTALNTALAADGALIRIGAGVELDRPVELIHLNLGQDAAALIQPRNLVVLEAGARATLVERFIGSGEQAYFNNNLTEILLGDGAVLVHDRLQEESRNATHLGSLYLLQGRDSQYRSTTLAFGGAWARTAHTVRFREEGAHCVLNGLYTAGDRQLTDFHLDVRHDVPGCTSRERFKGILFGKGRAVFDGRILVERQAQHSDAQLSNDNLMLSRDAEVDTKPQLEIYADDVRCSHGTTVGQLDPQQLFYLRSRGISEAAARRMLCLGFAADIVDGIAVEALRGYAAARLADGLGQALEV